MSHDEGANLQYAAINVMNKETNGEWRSMDYNKSESDYPFILEIIKCIFKG